MKSRKYENRATDRNKFSGDLAEVLKDTHALKILKTT